ncbi:MAG: hypothetical protein HDS18_02305 [Bacteroides sp.]|nr:hypothetical protein [Bacteroidales bacterium]MBD5303568.1 hypothetical protein [Bacteroides sp.]MBD5340205.1 hypothetical protein [Bacteroides sp.]
MAKDNRREQKVGLRSEKARKLIGDIPDSVVNWSIALTILFFVLLLLAVCFIPYPYSDGESIIMHILG